MARGQNLHIRLSGPLCLALLLVRCVAHPADESDSGPVSSPDSGTAPDSGFVFTDAGPRHPDGGIVSTDAGAPDSGSVVDAGPQARDGGAPDGGLGSDAGPPDGGAADAGPCGSDSDLCNEYGAFCGFPLVQDLCGNQRTVDCGGCGPDATCTQYFQCACNPGFNDLTGLGDCVVGLGAACTAGDGGQQNCPAGQSCVSYAPDVNVCTILGCTADYECGTNGESQNFCRLLDGGFLPDAGVDAGPPASSCQIECDQTLVEPCGFNPGLACYPATSACSLGCGTEEATYCNDQLYGTTCDRDSNGCAFTSCTSSSDCNPDGGTRVCFTDRSDPAAPLVYCVPDCRLAAGVCTNGKGCDPSTGGCDVRLDGGSSGG